MFTISFFASLVFISGVVFVCLSVCFMFLQKKRAFHYIGSAFMFVFGCMSLGGGPYIADSFSTRFPGFVSFVCMILISPLGLLVCLECFGVREKRKIWVLVVSAVSAAVFVSGSVLLLNGVPLPRVFIMVYTLLLGTFVTVVIREWKELIPFRDMTRGLFKFSLILFLDILLIMAMLVSQIFQLHYVLCILWTVQVLSIYGIVLIVFHTPETFRLIGDEANRIRYERVTLNKEKVDSSMETLDRLMRQERLFRRPSLCLEELAKRCSLTPHELSELLNLHMGQSFRTYLNGLRIDYARMLLSEQPDTPIIDIIYDCGFNSKSVFNAAFRASCGKTPSEWRKACSRTSDSESEE